MPTYTITSINATLESDTGVVRSVRVTGTFSSPTPAASSRLVALYVGRDNSVSRDGGALYNVLYPVGANEPGLSSSEFSIKLSVGYLREMGFVQGDRIHAVVYPAAAGSSDYYDAVNGKWVETRLKSDRSAVVDVLWQ